MYSFFLASLSFRAYLEVDIALSADQISKYVDKTQLYVNSTMKELRRLFLVQDLVDSIKVKTQPEFKLGITLFCVITSLKWLSTFFFIFNTFLKCYVFK